MARRKAADLAHIAAPLQKLAVPIADLNEDPANVRTHDEKNLASIRESLEAFGQRKPIVVRADGMVVTAGNGTLAAARLLGWPYLAAVVLDDDEATAQRYAIADNRTAELAEWDDAGLAAMLEDLRESDALDGVGFDSDELDALLGSLIDVKAHKRAPSAASLREARGLGRPPGTWEVHVGDAEQVVPTLDGFFDAVLCDPPYGISFMGKGWDHSVPGPSLWGAVHGALRPGAHVIAFGGTRLYHRLTCAIEDAGFEVRDCLMWLYGSGWPKSHDLSKAIDKAAGADREVVARGESGSNSMMGGLAGTEGERGHDITAPATPEAQLFEGYGTSLKPAWEPAILARKPLAGTVAENALEHGTGGLDVDGARVGEEGGTRGSDYEKTGLFGIGGKANIESIDAGRWPANVLLDADSADLLAEDVARFFYCAKASVSEREAGAAPRAEGRANFHPTLKPVDLTRYLAALLLPPPLDRPRRILVPFSGSGSEMIGCLLAGWDEVVGIELNEEYATIARARLVSWQDEAPEAASAEA